MPPPTPFSTRRFPRKRSLEQVAATQIVGHKRSTRALSQSRSTTVSLFNSTMTGASLCETPNWLALPKPTFSGLPMIFTWG